MAKEKKDQTAQDVGPDLDSVATSETATPEIDPPERSTGNNGGNVMTDTMPDQEPPATTASEAGLGGDAEAAPTLTPDAVSADAQGGIASWLNNKRVTALWGINQNRNSWVYIVGVGWKKLANNSDSAVVALSMLAASAKLTQTSYNYREEPDGMIHETYVW